jgi:general secretion pathway protein D
VNIQQNALTVEAERDVLDDITELIETQWDLPRPDGTSRLFVLKYTDPIKVRDLLQDVLGAGGGSSSSSGRGGNSRGSSGGSDATAGISGVYNIEAFPDRNALLVLAKTVEAFGFIESVIDEIDRPSDVGLPEVIPLKYANAVELSEEINILLARAGARVSMPRPSTELTAEGFSASGDSSGISISGPDTSGTSQDLNFPWQTGGNEEDQSAESVLIGKVRVVPIIRQNALAIVAPPAYRDSMVRLIHSFDRPRRQVMISATIIEVELGDNLNLGVKIGQGISASGNGAFTSAFSLAGVANGAVFPQTGGDPLQIFFDHIIGAGTNAVLSAGPFDINLIVEGLNTIANTRVLQEPRVFTADNEEAVFFSGLEYPVVSSITDSASAGLNTQTSVEYKNVGVFLNVRPRITEEGAVDLTVTLELSAVGPSAVISGGDEGTVASQIFTRKQVSTHVILLDGQTIVIGGLLKETESILKSKLPFLGDLPFIGGLFTHTEEKLERTELIAFLTPTVVHRPFDNYSNFNVNDLQRLEAVARPLQEQLNNENAIIDLNVFERISQKTRAIPPDQDPEQLKIDEGVPDMSLLRKLTPETPEPQEAPGI